MEFSFIDLAAFLLMLLFAYLLYKIEIGGIGDRGEASEPEGSLAPPDKETFSIYPSRLIRQAGIRPQKVFIAYWSAKFVAAFVFPLLLLEFGSDALPGWAIVVAGLGGFFCADLWMLSRRQRRRRQISDGLELFVNLLVAYLPSGMTLGQAFEQTARYGFDRRHPLAREVDLLSHEIAAGQDRDVAFQLLAERSGVADLRRLASLISIGYRVGAPLQETLIAQADLLKVRHAQRVTELVQRKSMEVMLPMFLICFPMFLLLIFFPASVQIFGVLEMLKDMI